MERPGWMGRKSAPEPTRAADLVEGKVRGDTYTGGTRRDKRIGGGEGEGGWRAGEAGVGEGREGKGRAGEVGIKERERPG